MKDVIVSIVPLLVAVSVYSALALQLNFIQDDAYISYRYVANYLNGHGLVYNLGERVEGITNFGWTLFLVFCGRLGLDYIVASKFVGYLCGAGVIVVTFLTARLVLGPKRRSYALLPLFLLGVNQSLAYWSPAGLETAAFALLASLSLLCFLRGSHWLIFTLSLAAWVRPEGALLGGILIGLEAIVFKRFPRLTLTAAAGAMLISLPFAAFKLVYYGSLLPNPFYAKTTFNIGQIAGGLEYTGRFLAHYGFYGAGFALSLLWYRKLTRYQRAVVLFALTYLAYVVLIGGDVLKVHRFFLPIFGSCAIIVTVVLIVATARVTPRTRMMLVLFASLPLLGLTYRLPNRFVRLYHENEVQFTDSQRFLAEKMHRSDSTQFTVATSTIGVFGYELIDHRVIDLLGLTDSNISRHSEAPPADLQYTWKELKHNSRYLLTQAPDYIVFSTGLKPSAPAEQVLLQYPQFLNSYRSVGWVYRGSTSGSMDVLQTAFKRIRPIEGIPEPAYPARFVSAYKSGLEYQSARQYRRAIAQYDEAMRVSPSPVFPYVVYNKAFCLLKMREPELARFLLDSLVSEDPMVYEAHRELYGLARMANDTVKAELHLAWLRELVPWYAPEVKRAVDVRLGLPFLGISPRQPDDLYRRRLASLQAGGIMRAVDGSHSTEEVCWYESLIRRSAVICNRSR